MTNKINKYVIQYDVAEKPERGHGKGRTRGASGSSCPTRGEKEDSSDS
jgi:hypothetical protein